MNYWTIDSIGRKFDSLQDAKNAIMALSPKDRQSLLRINNGKCFIRHWVKGVVVSVVYVRGYKFTKNGSIFGFVESAEKAKKNNRF